MLVRLAISSVPWSVRAMSVARIGGDEIAVWQNGMDHMTAAERADALCSARLFDDLPKGASATALDRHRQPSARQCGGRPSFAAPGAYGGDERPK